MECAYLNCFLREGRRHTPPGGDKSQRLQAAAGGAKEQEHED